MKFSCAKKDLVKTLTAISKAAIHRILPILEGVHIETGENCVKLTCNNLEFALMAEIPATVMEIGEIVIAADNLRKLAKKMTGDTLTISGRNEESVSVMDGKAPSVTYPIELSDDYTRFTLLGMNVDDYPKIPEIGQSTEIRISQCTLRSMLEQTLYAVAHDDSKPIHKGILFDLADCKLNLVSVDGIRLALRQEIVDSPEKTSFVVPGKCLSNIVKLLSEKNNADAILRTDGKNIIFELGGYMVFSRLLVGDFMNYNNAIPHSFGRYADVPVKHLSQAVGRAIEISGKKSHKIPLLMEFGADGINLAVNLQNNEYSEDVGCESFGMSTKMIRGINANYLMDVLKVLDCDKLRVELGTEFSPLRLVPTDDGEKFIHLLIPMKINKKQAA